jgi:KDO2-lipid IV(A) lauroyltransferase
VAEHLLVPKRLTRAMPWLRRAAWHVEAWFVRSVVWLLRLLPPERSLALAMRVMRVIGPLMPMWDKVGRNFAVAFPHLDATRRRTLQRSVFAYLGAAIAELVSVEKLWQQRESRLEFVADPGIRGIGPDRPPMVIVTAHVGAWQLANFIAARYDFPLTSLYAPESNPLLGDISLRLRDALPCSWRSRDGGVKRLIEELRAGRSVGLACDTRLDQGEAVAFFGQPAMTNTVPARLALRQGCELVPVHVLRLPGARYRITMEAPIVARNPAASAAEQALDMSAQMNARFESWIRATPSEWMCLARRFPKELDKAARDQARAAHQ